MIGSEIQDFILGSNLWTTFPFLGVQPQRIPIPIREKIKQRTLRFSKGEDNMSMTRKDWK